MSYKSQKGSPAGPGISFATVLFIVFLVLKLCGIIAWSWWWVTAPLWGGIAFAFAALLLFGIGVLILKLFRL